VQISPTWTRSLIEEYIFEDNISCLDSLIAGSVVDCVNKSSTFSSHLEEFQHPCSLQLRLWSNL
jgi:hypothetical protein